MGGSVSEWVLADVVPSSRNRLDENKDQSALGWLGLKRGSARQIRQIDIALESVGGYGQVHLILTGSSDLT